MTDSDTNRPGDSISSSTSKSAGESNTSTIPQLPIEILGLIWQFLSIKDRVKVQRVSRSWRDHNRGNASLWKNATYFSDHYTEPDICKDVETLSNTKQWTNMKFSRFAISFQSKTKEQMIALEKILQWLPSMEIQDLVINFNPNFGLVDFDSYEWKPSNRLDRFPGINFLSAVEAQHWVDNLQANLRARAHAFTIRDILHDAGNSIKRAVDMTQDSAISNCSHLRSLLLGSDFNMPFTVSRDDPITRCKLDILSLKKLAHGHQPIFLDPQAAYSMLKKARVLDLIECIDRGHHEMTIHLITAASQSLEYLTFDIDISAEDIEGKTSILNLPRLKHLHFSTIPINLKIDCPKLESLHLRYTRSIQYFSSIPSVKMLFIEKTYSLEDDSAWDQLAKFGADRLETLIIYNELLTLRSFLRFFSSANGPPRLQKLVILTYSGCSKARLNLDTICECSPNQLKDIRKIDTLIWQYDEGNEPALSTQAFIREHFATKMKCIKAPCLSLEYSAESMGIFVKHKSLVDKLLFFDKFLLESSRN